MNSSILFIPLILLFERDIIAQNTAYFASLLFWTLMTLAGLFWFLIGIVTILQIKLTSPLTHNICGTAKACIQTILAIAFMHESVTLRSVIGTCCVLLGTFMYSVVRSHEMSGDRKQSPKLAPARSEKERDLESDPLLLKRVWCVC